MRKITLLLLMLVVSFPLFSQNSDTIRTRKDITWNVGARLRQETALISNGQVGYQGETWYNPLPPNENNFDPINQDYWLTHEISFFPNSVNNVWSVQYNDLFNVNQHNESYCAPGTNICIKGNEVIWGLVVVLSINNEAIPFAYFFHSSEGSKAWHGGVNYDNLEYCQLGENGFSDWSKFTPVENNLIISSSSTMTSITYSGKILSSIPMQSDGVIQVSIIALPQARIKKLYACDLKWMEKETQPGGSQLSKPKLQKQPLKK